MKPMRKFLTCSTEVNKDAVRRETLNGVEHIVVSSYTLPDDVVMNGGLYPADEIASSYKTLERTLAPVEHPHDESGAFLSASDPVAIHNFHVGAFNRNVTRKDGRVHVEKWINVAVAMQSDKGRRLLDRVNELETSSNPRPIHTSTGLFLEVEPVPEPKTNAAGLEYTWIARNMVFDHDAILLDSVGAAQPHQGVGMAVNADGEKIETDSFMLPAHNSDEAAATGAGMSWARIRSAIDGYLAKLKPNVEGQSLSDKAEAVRQALERAGMATWIVELYDDHVIFGAGDDYFDVPYSLDPQGRATVAGIPAPVERVTTWTPKTNRRGSEAMKDKILAALNAAGVQTDGLNDEQVLAAYDQLRANSGKGTGTGAGNEGADLAAVVASALAPVVERLNGIETTINKKSTEEHAALAATVANSGKFPGLDEASAKLLPVDKLREMAANVGVAHAVPFGANMSNSTSSVPVEMPE